MGGCYPVFFVKAWTQSRHRTDDIDTDNELGDTYNKLYYEKK